MQFLTDFADQAVILPLTFASALGISLGGWKRGAVTWLLAIFATLGVVAVAKLVVFMLGPPGRLPLLLSPSGHAASASLLYGGLAYALLPGRKWRAAGAVLGAAAGLAVAAMRVALGVHTLPDVVVGLSIGLVGLALLCRALADPPVPFHRWGAVALSGATLVGFHGLRMPAEQWLRMLAALLRGG
jgi:membrane-associated phospholipid phosphatase